MILSTNVDYSREFTSVFNALCAKISARKKALYSDFA